MLRTITRPLTGSTRVRTITQWKFIKSPWGTQIRGIVTKDTEPDFATAMLRATTTSPIKHIDVESRIATTESGSKYTLAYPSEDQDDLDQIDVQALLSD